MHSALPQNLEEAQGKPVTSIIDSVHSTVKTMYREVTLLFRDEGNLSLAAAVDALVDHVSLC